MENNGRQKHVVEGNVAQIKKQEEGLGVKKSENREESFLAKLLKLFGSKEKK